MLASSLGGSHSQHWMFDKAKQCNSADIGDKSSAVGAIGDVVNKVVQLIQGMIDDDIKVNAYGRLKSVRG